MGIDESIRTTVAGQEIGATSSIESIVAGTSCQRVVASAAIEAEITAGFLRAAEIERVAGRKIGAVNRQCLACSDIAVIGRQFVTVAAVKFGLFCMFSIVAAPVSANSQPNNPRSRKARCIRRRH